ncbi:MAG TPA: hypothetical protein VLM88_09810 [Proteiniclasticum sp.]|nr:hypothetical protein [Proteiniclasticum sp.]
MKEAVLEEKFQYCFFYDGEKYYYGKSEIAAYQKYSLHLTQKLLDHERDHNH